MKNLYQNLGLKNFKKISFCIALIGDLCLLFYLYIKFTDQKLFVEILKQAWETKSLDPAGPSVAFATELFQVWVNSLIAMLILVGLFHLIIFLLWYNEKNAPKKYVSLYFRVAMVGAPLLGLFLIMSNPLWTVIFLALGLGYYFNLVGMTYFNANNQQ